MLKLRSTGRGRQYSLLRGVGESLAAVVYARDWPARVLGRIPAASRVHAIRRALPLGRGARAPVRLAFASDLHIGPLTPPQLLEEAFRTLAAFAPHVLVLGGDYVFLDVTARAAVMLERLVASVPAAVKVAVLGNHDLWTDHHTIERALTAGGARVLVNETALLPPPHDDVALVGLDEPWTGRPDAVRAFAGSRDAAVRIAVAHAPEAVPHVRGHGAALMLCGHTHGGQIALPSGPIVVYGPMGRRWPAGFHDADGVPLFVSRGIGTVDLPLRSWAPPDVALFEIH